MMERLRDPIALFRFALRERDWPLAGLLAGAMGAEMRPCLEHELRRAGAPAGAPESLGALRTLGLLIRVLRASERRG